MDDFLKRYRTRLKLSATQQLEETINQVFDMIRDESDLKNGIIMIQARYQNLEQDSFKGIVAEPDRVLRTNQIMDSLFQLVDNVQVTDLQETEDLLLNGYLKKYNEQILESKKAEAAHDPKRVTEDSSGAEGLSLTTVEDTKKQVREEGRETIPKSAKDLEIFSEMNQQTLSFYSVIYRDVRTIVIRNEKASLEIGEMMQHLEEQLSGLAYFKNNINQLEPILKKIRVDANKKVYWLQFQQLANRRTTLTMENLSDIKKWNKSLDDFMTIFKKEGII